LVLDAEAGAAVVFFACVFLAFVVDLVVDVGLVSVDGAGACANIITGTAIAVKRVDTNSFFIFISPCGVGDFVLRRSHNHCAWDCVLRPSPRKVYLDPVFSG
jgi:hypothetical protein